MKSLRIAAIGECMVEFSAQSGSDYRLGFAGDTFNTAVYLARLLGDFHRISYVTCLGDDALSTQMLEHFRSHQLDTTCVFIESGSAPGAYLINNDAQGERSFTYWRQNSAATKLMAANRFDVLREHLAQFDLIYLSGISLAILAPADQEKLIGLLKVLNLPIAFDPNYRPQLWQDVSRAQRLCEQVSEISQYLLTTFDDDKLMWQSHSPQQALVTWQDKTRGEIIIKNGEHPALLYKDDVSEEISPGEIIQPIDTTGAGDSFNAAYLAARLTGSNMQQAAALAHGLAGKVIGHRGAILPI
ncbi:MAG: sugar kinase [Arenicella sp.]|nr:sugar kinase [Arenicella sp.]